MNRTTLLLAAILAGNPAFADTLIYAGNVIDGKSQRAQSNITVRVADGRITAIDGGFTEPGADDAVVDLRDYTILPGLMDMHVHLTGEYSKNSNLNRFTHNAADVAIDAVKHARSTLMAGFTVVRNPGDSFNATVALRKAIDDGDVIGPRIFTAAKSLASTGGHADPTNGWASHIMGDPGPASGVINGIEDARKAVRQRYKDGADWIKITATGGVLSVAKSGQNPQFTDDELRAIVDTAADYDMRVAAHAHGTEGMKRAVLAGVASIEHGTFMDEEVMDLMIEHNTYYVPTIMAGEFVMEKATVEGFFPELVRPKAAAIGPVIFDTFAKAYKRGVPIVFGTDSGVSPHGRNGREFVLMVDAGMPAMEAIQSATSVAATFLGIDDELGSLETGKQADIVAVRGNPLDEIELMQHVDFVMQNGVIHKQP